MLQVTPFQGVRFDAHQVGSFDDVITPPYDVISPADRAQLAQRSPYNMVHLILPHASNGGSHYEAAATAWRAWRDAGVLRQDEAPGYYLLRQHFTDQSGTARTRTAFFATVKLPEEGEQTVLGHERTFPKPVEDRLLLTAATQANLGPVFGLYDDTAGELQGFLEQANKRPADITAHTIDGVHQEVWRVDADPAVAEFFASRRLYIADGHHRFRTALTYRDQRRAEEGTGGGLKRYDFVLMGLVAFNDPGLTIYAPHRIVEKPAHFNHEAFIAALEEWFKVVKVPNNLAERVAEAQDGCVIGMALNSKGDYFLRLRESKREALLGTEQPEAWRALDVAVLHAGILERILGLPAGAQHRYEKDPEAAMAEAHQEHGGITFILRPIKPQQVRDVADAGAFMPQKATYFFPKLPTGAVIHALT